MKKHFEQNSNENTDEKMQYFKDVNFFQIVIYIQCNPHLNSTNCVCINKLLQNLYDYQINMLYMLNLHSGI